MMIIVVFIFDAILRFINKGRTSVFDVNPTQVVVGRAVVDIESQLIGRVDAALRNLHNIALANIDISAVGWPWSLPFYLPNMYA